MSIITLARKYFNAKKCDFRYLIETERERERLIKHEGRCTDPEMGC